LPAQNKGTGKRGTKRQRQYTQTPIDLFKSGRDSKHKHLYTYPQREREKEREREGETERDRERDREKSGRDVKRLPAVN
jgi:hypothetical protein